MLNKAYFSIQCEKRTGAAGGGVPITYVELKGDDPRILQSSQGEGSDDSSTVYPEKVSVSSTGLDEVLNFIECAQKEAYLFFGREMKTLSGSASAEKKVKGKMKVEVPQDPTEIMTATVMNSSEWSKESDSGMKAEPERKKLKH